MAGMCSPDGARAKSGFLGLPTVPAFRSASCGLRWLNRALDNKNTDIPDSAPLHMVRDPSFEEQLWYALQPACELKNRSREGVNDGSPSIHHKG